MNPSVRTDLLIQEMGEEVVVYDHTTSTAHRLNHSAALVFAAANGTSSETQLVTLLEEQLGTNGGHELMALALQQLDEAQLLQTTIRLSRGQKTLLVGAGIALLLPVVETILAPSTAAAFSF